MRVIHSSDWHLGRSLYLRKRYDEFSAFLDWMLATIIAQNADVLLIAGDIFDTSMPSNRAQELYYDFLEKVAKSCCRHVVIIGGNHDSPSFLNAPKTLLRHLNVYVVGDVSDDLNDEVIVLKNNDAPEAIICAVPYLRDKDIRTVEAGESIDDKNAKLIAGIKRHYADVCKIAEEKQASFAREGLEVPIIAMGHLFTAGGKTLDGDGVRDLYVGSLAHVGSDAFPQSIDYLALGHLHISQNVGGEARLRYCGSPIPMGFSEANQEKKVVLLEFKGRDLTIKDISVPCFQRLLRIKGDLKAIQDEIKGLIAEGSQAWLEINYQGKDSPANLYEEISNYCQGSKVEVLRINHDKEKRASISASSAGESLDDLDSTAVFSRCLDAHELEQSEREPLMDAYQEIVKAIHEDDKNAE